MQDVEANPLRNTSKGARSGWQVQLAHLGNFWKMGVLKNGLEDSIFVLCLAVLFMWMMVFLGEYILVSSWCTKRWRQWGFMTRDCIPKLCFLDRPHQKNWMIDTNVLKICSCSIIFSVFFQRCHLCVCVKSCDVNPGTDQLICLFFQIGEPSLWLLCTSINSYTTSSISDIGKPPHICWTMLF